MDKPVMPNREGCSRLTDGSTRPQGLSLPGVLQRPDAQMVSLFVALKNVFECNVGLTTVHELGGHGRGRVAALREVRIETSHHGALRSCLAGVPAGCLEG